MSHAAPSCAGFAPRHSTSGVTTQKFGIGDARSLEHPTGTFGIDEDGKPQVRSANKKEKAGLRARPDPIGAISIELRRGDQPPAEARCRASIHRPSARTTDVSICLAGIDQ